MPVTLLIRLNEFGAMRAPNILATMIASVVRFATAPGAQLVSALACFDENADDLPLSWRPFDSPRRWTGQCMAGAPQLTVDGDLTPWPHGLRSAVRAAVGAARDAFASASPRSAQAAAYEAAHTALLASDVAHLLSARLARQFVTPPGSELARRMTSGLS